MSGPTEDLVQRILASLADEGDARAARLLEEARFEAEAEVRSLLKNAMKAALLRRAAARLDLAEPSAPLAQPEQQQQPPPRRPQPPPPPKGEADLACYVYAIARESPDASRFPPGVAPPRPPRVVRHRGLHAVVSDVPLDEFGQAGLDARATDVEWIGEKVRAHDAVVKSAAAAGAAAIPLRFCTVLRHEGDVRRVLDAHHVRIVDILDAVRGKSEWGVKVRFAAPAGAADEPESGRAYLLRQRERTAGSVPRAAREAAEDCHRQLAALAHEAVTLPLKHQGDANGARGGRVVLNAAYLVANDDVTAFEHLVESLGERHVERGLSLELTGPWPPYNFVNLDLSLEGAA